MSLSQRHVDQHAASRTGAGRGRAAAHEADHRARRHHRPGDERVQRQPRAALAQRHEYRAARRHQRPRRRGRAHPRRATPPVQRATTRALQNSARCAAPVPRTPAGPRRAATPAPARSTVPCASAGRIRRSSAAARSSGARRAAPACAAKARTPQAQAQLEVLFAVQARVVAADALERVAAIERQRRGVARVAVELAHAVEVRHAGPLAAGVLEPLLDSSPCPGDGGIARDFRDRALDPRALDLDVGVHEQHPAPAARREAGVPRGARRERSRTRSARSAQHAPM